MSGAALDGVTEREPLADAHDVTEHGAGAPDIDARDLDVHDADDSDELADSNPWLTVMLFAVAVVLGGGCLLLQFIWS